jgi:galactokinase
MPKKSKLSQMIAQQELERLVKKRTHALKEKNRRLEEMNTALKVLMEKRDSDKYEIETRVLSNVEQLINPYLEKLAESDLNSRQRVYLEILTTNLNESSHLSPGPYPPVLTT